MPQISMGDSCFLCTEDSVSRQCKDKECTNASLISGVCAQAFLGQINEIYTTPFFATSLHIVHFG